MRLVFFGVHGAFSTVPLRALVNAGLRPSLVVLGLERQAGQHAPKTERVAAGKARRWRIPFLEATDAPGPQEDLEKLAHEFGIDVLRTGSVADVSVRFQISESEPDAFVVAGFPQLLPQSVLQIARLGGLNVHPGALPQERGASPLFWALKEGRRDLSWTIHVLDQGEDTGDIVRSGMVHVEAGTHGQAILRVLATAAAPELLRCLRAMVAGDLVRMPQPKTDASRKRRPRFADGRIDPKLSAEEVFTFVAACADSYSLWAECAEDRFFVRRAVSFDPEVKTAPEWSLFSNRLLLRCNPGVVELELKDDGVLFASEYTEEPPAS